MNKKISLGAAIAYMAIVAAVVFCLTMFYSEGRYNTMLSSITEREKEYKLLSEVDQYARSNYFGTVDEDTLRASTAAGYIAGLGDPYAKYITAKEYEAYQKAEGTKYVGIGVVTELDADGYIRLKDVYPESPAAVAKMQTGDLIVSVDGTTANKDNYAELVGTFKGTAGTKISLVYRRDTEDVTVEITRREIDVPTIRSSTLGNIGYLRIIGVTGNSSAHLEKAIKQVSADGAQALVLDVRGLESDNMDSIGNMLDVLLPKMTMVFTQGRSGESKALMSSDEKEITLPMVVLADNSTKGAAELFVQALKDTGKAKVVGETTFGKGTLQVYRKLQDGSAVYLTTARYAGPSGVTYDKTGVAADYEIKFPAEMDKVTLLGNVEFDNQLKKAVEIATTAVKTESTMAAAQAQK